MGAIVGETAETMFLSPVAVYGEKDVYQMMTGVCNKVYRRVIV